MATLPSSLKPGMVTSGVIGTRHEALLSPA
jgi:hypothetical protein